jgi:hypothetical protein
VTSVLSKKIVTSVFSKKIVTKRDHIYLNQIFLLYHRLYGSAFGNELDQDLQEAESGRRYSSLECYDVWRECKFITEHIRTGMQNYFNIT